MPHTTRSLKTENIARVPHFGITTPPKSPSTGNQTQLATVGEYLMISRPQKTSHLSMRHVSASGSDYFSHQAKACVGVFFPPSFYTFVGNDELPHPFMTSSYAITMPSLRGAVGMGVCRKLGKTQWERLSYLNARVLFFLFLTQRLEDDSRTGMVLVLTLLL